ncbi:ABC transporter permease [Williamsia sterculiae]|uniref:NitT/TauT family transport system permease protein n=1 Tax=Williamsia sterculiae TaxID=1344003 RepID=A0A1N7CMH1_9NOCA|nr:ABC transporter permease [Williamsia sterculiae]SIR64614.1 NitT/TauT family transport system permease protein [Williamsia sterculiae]
MTLADTTSIPSVTASTAVDPSQTVGSAKGVRRRRVLSAAGTVLTRSVAIVAFLLLWEFAPRFGWVDTTFLPPFTQVVHAWWSLAQSGELWTDVRASLTRSLSGFAIAIVVAVPVGLLIAWYRHVEQVLSPLFAIFLNTAAVALLPVFTLILGIGETSKIAIIAYASFWPVLYNTIGGAKNVDPLLIRSARSFGIGSFALFRKVVLPAALPTIFTGIRLAGAASILVLITTEFVGAKAGLGYLISSEQFNFQIPQMYAGIITVAGIGVAFNYLLIALERRFSRWRTGA